MKFFVEDKIKGLEEIFETFTDEELNKKLSEHGLAQFADKNRDKAIYILALNYLSQDEIDIYIEG